MLISIVLTLVSDKPGLLPPFLGRANYAATLARIREVDATLAARIHDGDGPKPLTCSGLLDARIDRQGTHIEAGRAVTLRVTGLADEVSRGLEAGLLMQPPPTWELDGHCFQVKAAICDAEQHSWSGRTTYGELTARLAAAERPPREATLHFASPTSFRSGGMHMPLPLPGLVFGSLVERWNAFSPVTLNPETRRFGEEQIAISRYRLESRAAAHKEGGLRVGGLGRVTYTALSRDRYWLSVMQILADFAFYSGVGVQTAAGMGQTRRVG
jgi:CRISPR-associated endoribonuclease Cas6